MAETRSTCPYCGVGCGVLVEHDGAHITGVRGDPDHPANFGRLCTKGSTLHLTAAATVQRQVRALQPMQRAARGQPLRPVDWDDVLDTVAARFAAVIQRDGPDAVGHAVMEREHELVSAVASRRVEHSERLLRGEVEGALEPARVAEVERDVAPGNDPLEGGR